jgi:hypothetical protein
MYCGTAFNFEISKWAFDKWPGPLVPAIYHFDFLYLRLTLLACLL